MKLKNISAAIDSGVRSRFPPAVLLAGLALVSPTAQAVFDAAVSPPRFELKAKPGDVIRETLSVTNGAAQPARYGVKTADWELDDGGAVQYHEGAPGPDSCRPWARLERHTISVAPQGSRSYRFEVHVPPDAKTGECRFALLVSSEAVTVTPPGMNGIQIPVVGRLGIIVYVSVGEAKPELKLTHVGVAKINGKTLPVATFRNTGNAHGRVSGGLEAKDARGHVVELIAEEAAILPQASKTITLNPVDYASGEAKAPAFELVPPMHVRGKLQFLGGGEVAIDQVVR